MKQWWMPIASATKPWSTGMRAPPTIAMQRMPEPWLVCLPRPSMASVKIVGNMIELKRPTAMIAYIAVEPEVAIESAMSAMAPTACTPRTLPGLHIRQREGADERADHGAQPVERDQLRARGLRQAADVRLLEVVHEEA